MKNVRGPAQKAATTTALSRHPGNKVEGPSRAQSDGQRESLRGTLPADEITGALPPGGLAREAGQGEGLFGSVELPVASLNVSARWKQILDDDPAAFFARCAAGEACRSALHRGYETVRARHEGALMSLELLRDVNAAVNGALRYRSDAEVWGTADYWAEPSESATRGAGDCEDFAIAKFGMLAALGVPGPDMRIAVVKDLRRGIGHAVLAVRVGDVSWVLDNQSPDVKPDRAIGTYMPLYSVSVAGSFVHGIRRPVPLASLAPVRELAAAEDRPGLRPSLLP